MTNKDKCRAYYQKNKGRALERGREWRKNNREKQKASSRKYYLANKGKYSSREKNLMRRYGLRPIDVQTMITNQGNKCLICFGEFGSNKSMSPAIDHDHKTKRIRGILHHRCNAMIGMAWEREDVFRNAIAYLTKRDESIKVKIWRRGNESWFQQEGHPWRETISFMQK